MAVDGGIEAARWDGVTWTAMTLPNPAGATTRALQSVSCASSTDCTAVGWSQAARSPQVPLAEHFNGSKWTVQPTPAPAGAQRTFLADVSCRPGPVCTAVGASLFDIWVPFAERYQ